MAENQFVVDLGTLKLSDAQRKSMNAAIQGAVAKELASHKLSKRVVFIPVDKWPKGPIINGIIIRDLGNRFDQILKIKDEARNIR